MQFLQQLNTTISALENQALPKPTLQALSLWAAQAEEKATLLEEALVQSVPQELTSKAVMLHPAITESLTLMPMEAYDALSQLTPVNLVEFVLLQEFGPNIQEKAFYSLLAEMAANKLTSS